MRRPHQSTPMLDAHDQHDEFRAWPKAAILVLRAMASGERMDTNEIELESQRLGDHCNYAAARKGVLFLEGWRSGMVNAPNKTNALCIYMGMSSFRGASTQRLTDKGVKLAAQSLRIWPPSKSAEQPQNTTPPDPATPLYRVLHDDGETLVIASDKQAAISLFEKTTDKQAHRAIPIETDTPMVLGWSTQDPKKRD